MDAKFSLTVNGRIENVTTDPDRPLLDMLREDLHLTGTKYGCGEGMCRACTVLMDGEPVQSCITPVSLADKKSIVTIDGLARLAIGDALHPVQQAFMEEARVQCGYCLPGIIMAAAALLRKTPHPTDREIVSALDGHLCRCCGYPATLNAIQRAAGRVPEGSKS